MDYSVADGGQEVSHHEDVVSSAWLSSYSTTDISADVGMGKLVT